MYKKCGGLSDLLQVSLMMDWFATILKLLLADYQGETR